MIQRLKEKLESIIPITDELWCQIQSEWEEIQVKKGEKLVRYGEINKKIYFVLKGSLEISMILNDGSAKSVWFFRMKFSMWPPRRTLLLWMSQPSMRLQL